MYEGCMIIPRNSILLYMQRRWFLSILKDHPPAWRYAQKYWIICFAWERKPLCWAVGVALFDNQANMQFFFRAYLLADRPYCILQSTRQNIIMSSIIWYNKFWNFSIRVVTRLFQLPPLYRSYPVKTWRHNALSYGWLKISKQSPVWRI